MTHVSERINNLVSATSSMTLFNLNGVGNRKGIEDAYNSARTSLRDYVEALEDKIERLEAITATGIKTNDLADKADAWDQCVKSSQRARKKALLEAAAVVDSGHQALVEQISESAEPVSREMLRLAADSLKISRDAIKGLADESETA